MKYKRLIYVQVIVNVKVHLELVKVLSRGKEIDVSDVLKVSL